jgi:NitT/TauT family transport system permease protein
MQAAASVRPAQRPRRLIQRSRSLSRVIAPVAVLLAVMAMWQGGVFHRLLNVREFTLAYPSQILAALIENQEPLWRHATATLTEAMLGYAIGSTIGFLLAVGVAMFATLRGTVLPVMSGFNSMPIVALAPLMTLYFGTGMWSKVAVVTLMTTAPMTVTAYKGLTAIDAAARELMRSLAATPAEEFRKLRIPSSAPYVFTALKLNVTLALIGAIIAEFFSAVSGLGVAMNRALVSFDLPLAWASMAIAGVVGVLWYLLVGLVERFVIPWHASQRRP